MYRLAFQGGSGSKARFENAIFESDFLIDSMNESFYIFNNPGRQIGYITSQFIEGARLAGCQVSTNVESLSSDGRFCKADLRHHGVIYRAQPSPSDIILIDEVRILSAMDDLGSAAFDYYIRLKENFRLALFYSNDDVNYLTFPESLSVFLPHQLDGFSKNPRAHCVPWGFTAEGFALAGRTENTDRKANSVIVNFNPTYSQSVREAIVAAIEPKLASLFELDRRNLFNDDYAEQLKCSQFIIAVGGCFHWPKSDYSYLRARMSERDIRLDEFPGRSRTVGITRWDSFRFWEAMAFGCLPIQLDFDKYGFMLPNMPAKWAHYIPLDLCNLTKTLDILGEFVSDAELMGSISERAKKWAVNTAHPTVLFRYVSDRL